MQVQKHSGLKKHMTYYEGLPVGHAEENSDLKAKRRSSARDELSRHPIETGFATRGSTRRRAFAEVTIPLCMNSQRRGPSKDVGAGNKDLDRSPSAGRSKSHSTREGTVRAGSTWKDSAPRAGSAQIGIRPVVGSSRTVLGSAGDKCQYVRKGWRCGGRDGGRTSYDDKKPTRRGRSPTLKVVKSGGETPRGSVSVSMTSGPGAVGIPMHCR